MPNRDSIPADNHQPMSPISASNMSSAKSKPASYLESEHIRTRIVLINSAVLDYLQQQKGEPPVLYNAAHHLIVAGGKRLRSLVTLLACEAVGGSIEKVLPITVAAELLQTASLIHDDIIDKDDMRRGVPTVHKKYGHDVALLAGDFLIAQALRIIGTHGSPELMANIGAGGVRMCEGEVLDLFITPEQEAVFTTKEYLKMIERKTAVFLEEAARTGAIVGQATQEEREALAQFGSYIGFSFQLRDDVLDIQAPQNELNKSVFSDFRMKRGNYPLLYTLENCSANNRNICLQALEKHQWDTVLALIDQNNAYSYTMQLAQSYVECAKGCLKEHKFLNQTVLEQLADFTIQRDF
ncbi:MAG: polyprenyl synthetase family protein [Promethearchaeota archaeon]